MDQEQQHRAGQYNEANNGREKAGRGAGKKGGGE